MLQRCGVPSLSKVPGLCVCFPAVCVCVLDSECGNENVILVAKLSFICRGLIPPLKAFFSLCTCVCVCEAIFPLCVYVRVWFFPARTFEGDGVYDVPFSARSIACLKHSERSWEMEEQEGEGGGVMSFRVHHSHAPPWRAGSCVLRGRMKPKPKLASFPSRLMPHAFGRISQEG